MPHIITVKDYYENDYNGLWSWYLNNLRKGEFEELTGNILKYSLLKKFLKEFFYKNNDITNDNHENSDKKILLVSVPDKIYKNQTNYKINILENFLKDYFKLDDLTNIHIEKLTKKNCKIYNHETHYLIMDPLNNFKDKNLFKPNNVEFLKEDNEQTQSFNNSSIDTRTTDGNQLKVSVKPVSSSLTAISQLAHQTVQQLSSHDTESYNDNEDSVSMVSEMSSSSSSSSSASSPTSSSSLSSSGSSTTTSNDSQTQSELQIDFANKLKMNKNDESLQESCLTKKITKETQQIALNGTKNDSAQMDTSNTKDKPRTTSSNNRSSVHTQTTTNTHRQLLNNNGHLDNDVQMSIASFNYTTDDDFGAELQYVDTRDDHSYDAESQHQQGETSVFEDTDSEYIDDMGSSVLDEELDHEHGHNGCGRNGNDDDDYSMNSIFPSISIKDDFGEFRLVLQSILIENPEYDINNKQVDNLITNTAIRQSNMDPTNASIHDDWLLYDAKFDITNLQMLSLSDVLYLNKNCPKMLFYTMVDTSNPENLPQEEIKDIKTDSHHHHRNSPVPLLQQESETQDKDMENEEEEIQEFNADMVKKNINSFSTTNFLQDFENQSADGRSQYSDDRGSYSDISSEVKLYNANTNVTTTSRNPYVVQSFYGNDPKREDDSTIYDGISRQNTNARSFAESNMSFASGLSNNGESKNPEKTNSKHKNKKSGKSVGKDLTKVFTLGSLHLVERSKTLPPTTTQSNTEAAIAKQENTRYKRLLMRRKPTSRSKNNSDNNGHHGNNSKSAGSGTSNREQTFSKKGSKKNHRSHDNNCVIC
ncbi:Protein GIS4 [Hanseniaspora osmophila]|uniref:Protein GIS4 n=1 Tax=Hanseniaspora osmophila TaxID=56408 RepID=A0A1E5R001_9ASCO|nr:Protein GIS4 [Hanseniaspora osmophila]